VTDTEDESVVEDEDGDLLTSPDAISRETALEVIEVLDSILDEGDWYRLEDAAYNRFSERHGKYAYTVQDRNLAVKIKRLNEIRSEHNQFERLDAVYGESEESDE
jgi:hypothetical protein